MRRQICRGIDQQIWCVIEDNIKKIYLDYYITEYMIDLPRYDGGPFTLCFPWESSLLHQILLHEEKIVTREEWMMWWLEQAVEISK